MPPRAIPAGASVGQNIDLRALGYIFNIVPLMRLYNWYLGTFVDGHAGVVISDDDIYIFSLPT